MDELRTLLVAVATRGEVLTYDELRSRLKLEGDLVPLLRAVAEAEDDAGRGLLSAVVIRSDTGRPGPGWFRLAADRGRDVSDQDAAWRAELAFLSDVARP